MIITEGYAKIFYKKEWLQNLSSSIEVFYNPHMQINRDFTILILKYLYEKTGRKLKILDSMAASGIRSIRILLEAKEIVEELFINDINKDAIKHIKQNLELNNIKLEDNIKITNKDTRILMLEYKNYFDYIDIDPFGSPVGFIQPATLSLKNRGILGVTATDISALSGSKPKACFRKYGCIGMKTDFYLEFGIRTLIKYVIEEGLKFNVAFIPLFGYYYRHHYRVFFIKSTRKKDINFLIDKIKFIFYCQNCLYKNLDEDKCPICGNSMKMLGPIYIGSIYDKDVIEYLDTLVHKDKNKISETTKKIFEKIYKGDFVKNYLWYYYDVHSLAKVQKIAKIPKIKKILEKYDAVRSHYSPTAIKSEEYIDLRKLS